MNLSKFESEIKKTGFHLENQIARLLRSDGWTVISNKYYVDDQQESVREIDLVAYRAKRGPEFAVFTTLIISCKKSEKNVWALLARDIDRENPNYDWWPTHIWSNNRAVSFVFNQPGWGQHYMSGPASSASGAHYLNLRSRFSPFKR
jgi:hypothetical protein